MSYIVAFVRYAEDAKAYPVECFRTDIAINDHVIVRRKDGKLNFATVAELKFLNWDCGGRIECKKSECQFDEKNSIILSSNSFSTYGVSTDKQLVNGLEAAGWIYLKPKQVMHRYIHANTNNLHIAYIFVRKNGVDLQMIFKGSNKPPQRGSLYNRSFSEGKVVRHALAHTTFNLFEGILRFSNSFINNERNLNRYFVPQGSTDKRTEELKQYEYPTAKSRYRSSSNPNIYDINSSGVDGEPVYLGDGIWATSDGNTHDWGR